MDYINAMNDRDHLLLPTELNVEGTCFDVEYFARWIEAQRVGLWHWSDWETALMYRDPERKKAAPIAESGREIIEQAKEEAFFAWGL